jgi:hypothetical protein
MCAQTDADTLQYVWSAIRRKNGGKSVRRPALSVEFREAFTGCLGRQAARVVDNDFNDLIVVVRVATDCDEGTGCGTTGGVRHRHRRRRSIDLASTCCRWT